MSNQYDFIKSQTTQWEDKRDFLISGEITEKIKAVSLQDRKYTEYSQKKFSWSSDACTLFSPLTIASSLFNIRLSDDKIVEMWEYAVANGWYVAGEWNSTWNGMRTFCNWRNESFDDQVIYFRVPILSEECAVAIQKGLGIWLTYKANWLYTKDHMEDGELDGVSFGEPTFWHTHAFFGAWKALLGVNNYYEYRKPNRYMVQIKNMSALITNGVYYPMAYIIIPKEVISSLPLDVVKWLTARLSENSKKWHEVNNHPSMSESAKADVKNMLHSENNEIRDMLK